MMEQARAGQIFRDEDRAFHQVLCAHCPPLLGQLSEALWNIHMTALDAQDFPIEKLDETAAAHGRMLTAAQNGDLSGYLRAIEDHYRPLLETLDARSGES